MSNGLSLWKLIESIGRILTRLGERRWQREDPSPIASAEEGLRRSLAVDAFNYFLSKVVPGLTGFLSVPVFVRLVGYENYGRFTVLLLITLGSSSVFASWLAQGILRFHTRYQTDDAVIYRRATVFGSLLSLIMGVLCLGLGLRLLGGYTFWISILGVVLLAAVIVYTIVLARIQAMLRSGTVIWVETVRSITAFLIPVPIIWLTGFDHFSILLVGVLVGYVLPIVGWIRRTVDTREWPGESLIACLQLDDLRVLRSMWSYGWPVGVWALCLTAHSVADRSLLQMFSGYGDAGIYASMYDGMVRSLSLLCFPIAQASNSLVMARWNADDRRGALSLIVLSLKYQVALFLLFLAILLVLGSRVPTFILGSDRQDASTIVLPLAVAGFLWQISYIVHKPLEILCRTRRMLVAMMVSLGITTAGNWYLVPEYGYRASAYVAIAAPFTYVLIILALTPFANLRQDFAVRRVSLPSEGVKD